MSSLHPQSKAEKRATVAFVIVVVCLLIVGAAMRLWNLNDFPQQVHNDESTSIVDGIMHFMPEGRGGWALFGSSFGGHPNLSYWMNALPSRVIGEVSLWSARMGAALAGTLSLALLALFVCRAYGRRVGIFFLIFIIPYHLHYHFSRTAFPYVYALVGMGLVSYAFVLFLKAPSRLSALVTGLVMGVAALTYPATHVLPAAIIAAVVIKVWPDLIKGEGAARGSFRFFTMALCFILGVLIALTPHIIYSYRYGHSSRLTQTFVLHEHNLRHLGPQTGDPTVTPAGVVWFNMKRTARIFYSGDTAEQYQFHENPFPLWGACLAVLGTLVLITKSFRRDPVAIYVVVAGISSFAASGLMVEGNFSPHLILFAVITPLAMALAVDKIVGWLRLNYIVVLVPLSVALGVVWADWNWKFYNRVVSTDRSRLTRAVTYLLRLPITTKEVTTVIGAAGVDVYPDESYYQLIYPRSKQFQLGKDASVAQVVELTVKRPGSAVVVEDEGSVDQVRQELEKLGKKVDLYRYPQFPAIYLYVHE